MFKAKAKAIETTEMEGVHNQTSSNTFIKKHCSQEAHIIVIMQALMVYCFEATFASRGFHVYKETTWLNVKVGDKINVEVKSNLSRSRMILIHR